MVAQLPWLAGVSGACSRAGKTALAVALLRDLGRSDVAAVKFTTTEDVFERCPRGTPCVVCDIDVPFRIIGDAATLDEPGTDTARLGAAAGGCSGASRGAGRWRRPGPRCAACCAAPPPSSKARRSWHVSHRTCSCSWPIRSSRRSGGSRRPRPRRRADAVVVNLPAKERRAPSADVMEALRAARGRDDMRRGRHGPARSWAPDISRENVAQRHEDLPRPQPRQRRRVHVLRPRLGPRAHGRPGDRARPEGHRDPEPRGARRHARGHRDLLPRLPVRRRPLRAHAVRRQHRRRLRPAARGARAPGACRHRIAAWSRCRARSPRPTWPSSCSRPAARRGWCRSTGSSTRCARAAPTSGSSSTKASSPTAATACTRSLDLGAWWKEETGLPLPLGGNAVRRDLGPELMARLTRARARDRALLARPSRGGARLRA